MFRRPEETVRTAALLSESGFVRTERADLGRASGHGPVLEATGFTPAEKDQADLQAQRVVPAASTVLLTAQ